MVHRTPELVEQLVEDGQLDVDELARRFSTRPVFGMGRSVRRFRRNMAAGLAWREAAARSAGNGALMRIAPVLLPHLSRPNPDLWVDAALAAAITHNDPASIAACVAFVGMLWQLLGMHTVPAAGWWVDSYVACANRLEGETRYRVRPVTPSNAAARSPRTIVRGTNLEVRRGTSSGSVVQGRFGGGRGAPVAVERLPARDSAGGSVHPARHADDPEEAIVRAVNDTYDNDTIGAIVGAAVGALYGEALLPQRWSENLLGRTSAADDRRVFELMAAAERLVP